MRHLATYSDLCISKTYAAWTALTIFPDFMHRVQTFFRPTPPAGNWTRTL